MEEGKRKGGREARRERKEQACFTVMGKRHISQKNVSLHWVMGMKGEKIPQESCP